MPECDEVEYVTRTFSLKTKGGIFAWLHSDGSERFPGVIFGTPEEANKYLDKESGGTFVLFEKRT